MKKAILIFIGISILYGCKKEEIINTNTNSTLNTTTINDTIISNDTTSTTSNNDSIIALNPQISLIVYGFQDLEGDLAIAINNSSDQFTSNLQAYKDTIINVNSDTMIILIDSILTGTYAVSLFHDENQNGELDLGFLNIPEEGFGFSNNPTILFSQPDFDDCKFIK